MKLVYRYQLLTWIKKLFAVRFIRFSISGGAGTVVDVSLLYLLTEFIHLWYLHSALISFIIGTIVHYLISRRWVFNSSVEKKLQQGLMFFAVQSLGLVINISVLFILVEYFHLWYIAAKLATVVVAVSLNFNLNKYLTFRQ